MLAILQLAVFGLLGLSAVYILVSIYSRSVRRETLEKDFDANGTGGDREAFIADGMARYQHSLRRRLIVLVYLIPIAIVAVTIYLVNWQ